MTFPHNFDYKQWSKTTLDTLRVLRHQTGSLCWTQPMPDQEAQQPFYSALHAIVWRWLNEEMASEEISSASSTQIKTGDDAGFIPIRIDRSGLTEPSPLAAMPLLAYATVQVYHITGDYNLLERMWPRVQAQHNWFDRVRDPEGTGLVTLIDPVENPLDGTVETFNALRAADLDAVAHIAYDLGLSDDEAAWQARADAAKAAVYALWPTAQGAAFRWAALFAQAVDEDQVAELAAESATLPYDSMITAWMAYTGLLKSGQKLAQFTLAERAMRLLSTQGFYANYLTGAEPGFPAAGLALDMFARERQGGIPRPQCI
jgi:glycogen debranching enzyme